MAEQLNPEARVTIIIEGMGETTEIRIPLAARPTFAKSLTHDITSGEPAEEYLAFSCYGLYDINRNHTHQVIRS